MSVTPSVQLNVSGARGASVADIARRTGAYGVSSNDTDQQFLDKMAAFTGFDVVTPVQDRAGKFAQFVAGGNGRRIAAVDGGPEDGSLRQDLADPNAGGELVSHNLNVAGSFDYTLAQFASQFVTAAQFNIIGSGDETAKVQAAINYGAATGRTVVLDGFDRISVTGLTCPGGTSVDFGDTELFLLNGSNKPILRSDTDTFGGARPVKNIRIVGRTPLNCNAPGQSERGTDGVWLAGVRFTGVEGLDFRIPVRGGKRFAIWLTNVKNFNVESIIYHDSGDPVLNKDGLHVNGWCEDGRYIIRNVGGNDDAVAYNADDNAPENDFGAPFTRENVNGPIRNVHGSLQCDDCIQGLRVLNATQNIIDCSATITGNVSNCVLNIDPYNLGSGGLLKNLRVNIHCGYNAFSGGVLDFINCNLPAPASGNGRHSIFLNIIRDQIGEGPENGDTRVTLRADIAGGDIQVDYLEENNAGHQTSVYSGGAGSGGDLIVRRYVRKGDRIAPQYVARVGEYRVLESVQIGNIALDNFPITGGIVCCDNINGGGTSRVDIVGLSPAYFSGDGRPLELRNGASTQMNMSPYDPTWLGSSPYRTVGTAGPMPKVFPARTAGSTASRPEYMENGFVYFDTSLTLGIVKLAGAWYPLGNGSTPV
jgi:hypothetical protein